MGRPEIRKANNRKKLTTKEKKNNADVRFRKGKHNAKIDEIEPKLNRNVISNYDILLKCIGH